MLALDPFASINGDSINYIPVMWFFVAELGALLFVRYSNMRKTGSSTLCQGCWLRTAKKVTRRERSRAEPPNRIILGQALRNDNYFSGQPSTVHRPPTRVASKTQGAEDRRRTQGREVHPGTQGWQKSCQDARPASRGRSRVDEKH